MDGQMDKPTHYIDRLKYGQTNFRQKKYVQIVDTKPRSPDESHIDIIEDMDGIYIPN